jgi:hypothetical protein
MQTTKEEIRKIKGEIEEVRFLGQAGGQYWILQSANKDGAIQ